MKLKRVTVYADGSSDGKSNGRGGWGAVLIGQHKKLMISGYSPCATNNTMELSALLFALRSLKEPCEVEAVLDSQYVINGFAKGWVKNWKENGWVSSSGEPVKNKNLWIELDLEVARHKMIWRWVKGHSGERYNEEADKLAREAKQNKEGVRLYEDIRK